MIISHSMRFIFIKNAKVGGTSFEIRTSPFLSDLDVITPFGIAPEDEFDEAKRLDHSGGRGPQNFRKTLRHWGVDDYRRRLKGKQPWPLFYHHMSAEACREVLGAKLFDSYCKIAIVRDPFDMAISAYYWEQQSERGFVSKSSFEDWLLKNAYRLTDNWAKILVGGKVCLDIAVPYEHPSGALEEFRKRVGLPEAFISNPPKLRAKAGIRPKAATVDFMFSGFREGIVAVQDACAEQIAHFEHKIPGEVQKFKRS